MGWNAAKALGLTREEQDAWALRSHQRAIAAMCAGGGQAGAVLIEA